MKLLLAKMKPWWPFWVGIVVGLGLWAWEIFQRLNHNDNFLPFYSRPGVWLVENLLTLIKLKPPGQPPTHFYIFFIVASLSYILYFVVLGALLGLLFHGMFWLFRKLKHRNAVRQTEIRPNPPPP